LAQYDDDDAAGVGPEDLAAIEEGRDPTALVRTREGRERRKPDRVTVERTRAEIAGLYSEGVYLHVIAERMNMTRAGVQYHLNQLVNYWREMGLKSMDAKKAHELAYLSRLERLATEAYFASMQGRRTTMKETTVESLRRNLRYNEQAKRKRAEKETEREDEVELSAEEVEAARQAEQAEMWEQEAQTPHNEKTKEYERVEDNEAGDPRWMQILMELSDRRCKLWGLYVKEAVPGEDEASRLEPEARGKRIAAIIDEARRRQQVVLAQGGAGAPPPPAGPEQQGDGA
jgi:DNA-binding MarR family transcriptional regulator